MGNLGTGEIILIIVVILIFFGPKKIPEIAQGIGKGMREFKKAMRDVEDEIKHSDVPKSAPKNIEAGNPETHIPGNPVSGMHGSVSGTTENTDPANRV